MSPAGTLHNDMGIFGSKDSSTPPPVSGTTPVARPSTAFTISTVSVSYVSPSGTDISIPPQIDPYEALGVTASESIRNIKQSFAQSLNTVHRVDRVVASLSYYMIMSKSDVFRKSGTVYEIANPNHFLFATVGDTGKQFHVTSLSSSAQTSTSTPSCT